jgi:hypothetical protein
VHNRSNEHKALPMALRTVRCMPLLGERSGGKLCIGRKWPREPFHDVDEYSGQQ